MCADTFSQEIMRSTSQHIFEKVLICIERDLYNVYFKEINLFKNRYVFSFILGINYILKPLRIYSLLMYFIFVLDC